MSRISAYFEKCKKEGRVALIPFITAGDPERSVTVPTLHAMVEAGADIIELGIPFSEPMADGPTIQRSSERALEQKIGIQDVLKMVAEFRQKNQQTPIVLMGYLNPIENMGYREFFVAAKEAGADGVLTVDLPPEEGTELRAMCVEQGLDPIFLLAPNSTKRRIQKITDAATGFLYYVSVKGVTGAKVPDVTEVKEKVELIREYSDLPVGVGFGIKDVDSAKAIGEFADGVVVGSALVAKMGELKGQPEQIPQVISGLLKELRGALDTLQK